MARTNFLKGLSSFRLIQQTDAQGKRVSIGESEKRFIVEFYNLCHGKDWKEVLLCRVSNLCYLKLTAFTLSCKYVSFNQIYSIKIITLQFFFNWFCFPLGFFKVLLFLFYHAMAFTKYCSFLRRRNTSVVKIWYMCVIENLIALNWQQEGGINNFFQLTFCWSVGRLVRVSVCFIVDGFILYCKVWLF